MEFEKAKANAVRILKGGKMPKTPGDLAKDIAAFNKAKADAVAVRNDFEAKILAIKQAASKACDTAEAYKDVFEGSDFGLDPKDKDQKKQIDQATKTLTSALDSDTKDLQALKTVLEAVMKQIAGIKKSLDAAT